MIAIALLLSISQPLPQLITHPERDKPRVVSYDRQCKCPPHKRKRHKKGTK